MSLTSSSMIYLNNAAVPQLFLSEVKRSAQNASDLLRSACGVSPCMGPRFQHQRFALHTRDIDDACAEERFEATFFVLAVWKARRVNTDLRVGQDTNCQHDQTTSRALGKCIERIARVQADAFWAPGSLIGWHPCLHLHQSRQALIDLVAIPTPVCCPSTRISLVHISF